MGGCTWAGGSRFHFELPSRAGEAAVPARGLLVRTGRRDTVTFPPSSAFIFLFSALLPVYFSSLLPELARCSLVKNKRPFLLLESKLGSAPDRYSTVTNAAK